jgi:hypothetical protein
MTSGEVEDKAVTGAKEQVHVFIRQTREGIKGDAINSHRDRSREEGAFIELHPVGVVVIRHGTLNQSQAFPSILYTANSVKDVLLSGPQYKQRLMVLEE